MFYIHGQNVKHVNGIHQQNLYHVVLIDLKYYILAVSYFNWVSCCLFAHFIIPSFFFFFSKSDKQYFVFRSRHLETFDTPTIIRKI